MFKRMLAGMMTGIIMLGTMVQPGAVSAVSGYTAENLDVASEDVSGGLVDKVGKKNGLALEETNSIENELADGFLEGEVVSVSLGNGHSGAITRDGSLYMWGENYSGQVGNGTTEKQTVPVKILNNVASVSLGDNYSGAITQDGSLYMWGQNKYGQVGNGTWKDQTRPVKVLDNVVSVSLEDFDNFGYAHSGAITKDGSLYMWGCNRSDEVGNGISSVGEIRPVKVLDNVASVSLGEYHSGAITKDGSLYMWGYNFDGEVGNGTTIAWEIPVKVLDNVTSFSLGDHHSGAITRDGSLYMWGANHAGQVGNGTKTYQTTPVKVLDNVATVNLGYMYSGAITRDGSLYMWGANNFGQVGNGTETDQTIPVKVLDNIASVNLEFAQGSLAHSGAITEDGSLYMWGANCHGEMGNGTTVNQIIPIKVLDNAETVSLGDHHSGALTKDSSLYMWGYNFEGEVGNGTTTNQLTPVKIIGKFSSENNSYIEDKVPSNSTISSFTLDPTATVSTDNTTPIFGKLTLDKSTAASYEILKSEFDKIQWKSSDQDIVADSAITCSGPDIKDTDSSNFFLMITPKKEGQVTITGTTSNGLTASCFVTIKNKETNKAELSIDSYTKGTLDNMTNISGKLKIAETGESAKTILYEEARNIKWESSDPSVAAVTGCKITNVNEQGWAELEISLIPRKNGKATITGTLSSGLKASGEIEIADSYIIRQVARYTSNDIYEAYNQISKSNDSIESKRQKYFELFSNYGITDVREGIAYLSDTTAEQYAYRMLTTDECYIASQFTYELKNTVKGKAMRAALVADGLIFNSEWKTWTDPLSLAASSGEFPGVKKYKEMLYDYMQAQSQKIELMDYTQTVTDLADKVVDVTKAQILHEVNDAKDPAKLLAVMRKYSYALFTYDSDEKKITFDESSGFGKFAKAEGYASTGISIISTALEDIMGFIQLDSRLKAYEENKDFLNEVMRSANDLPSEMRYAAYLIREEMEKGVGANLKDLALDIMDLTVKNSELTKNMFTEVFKAHGFSAPGNITSFLALVDMGVWFSNKLLDMETVVKKAAYVEGYAYLAKHFADILEQNKKAFLAHRTEENAWNFYYTYHTLYQIRQKGEESYLAMCDVQGLAGALAKKGIHYEWKKDVVDSILQILKDRCQFTLIEGIEVPKSASYYSKYVVECPVNVEVVGSSGNVVARLSDQMESDVTNSYGRFAVVYMPYTKDYAKVICLNQNSGCSIRLVGTDTGLVNLEMATKTKDGISAYKINNEAVSRDTVIYIDPAENNTGTAAPVYQKWESANPEKIERKALQAVSADKAGVAVSQIRLDKEKLELGKGETEILHVTVYPADAGNQRVRWMSGDEAVVTVKDGKVSAVNEGETIIYCMSLDNLDISASCSIKVNTSQKKDAYTISYHLNGGSVSGNPTSYTQDTLPITLKNPVRNGYTFTGWTGSNGDTPQRTVKILKDSTGNRSYTANWSKEQSDIRSINTANISLSKTTWVYDGQSKLPSVIVGFGSEMLEQWKDYTVTYQDNQKVGTACVTISGIGKYTGKVTKKFKIVPKGTSLSRMIAKSRGFTIRWKKQVKSTDGYQIQYSKSKKFAKKSTVAKAVKKPSKTKLYVKKCGAKKKYYIRIRTYKGVQGKKYYSGWSKVKAVTTKK